MVARQDVGNGDGPQQPGEGGGLRGAAGRPGEPTASAAPRSVYFPAGASSAESAGAGLRETPVPPPRHTAQSCAGAQNFLSSSRRRKFARVSLGNQLAHAQGQVFRAGVIWNAWACVKHCCNLLKSLLVLMVNYFYVGNIIEVYFPINRQKPEPGNFTPCGACQILSCFPCYLEQKNC